MTTCNKPEQRNRREPRVNARANFAALDATLQLRSYYHKYAFVQLRERRSP